MSMPVDLRAWPWNELAIVLQLAYTVLLSGLIGWERERHRRPAGLRTHILVALSATMITAMGELFVRGYVGMDDVVSVDPSRMVHGLLTGIGFIGAGTIFHARRGDTVLGVTTAASLFAVTVLGIAVGLGFYVLAAAAALIIFSVLRILRGVERSLAQLGNGGGGDERKERAAPAGRGARRKLR
jgi:putative Mg2+ transporter-C (MgtC) family protein